MQTERVTRSRARTLAASGATPSLAALPDKTPVTRTTRRRAAAAATAPPAAAPASACVDAEQVKPVVLFDVTNDQDSVAPSAPPAEPAAPAEVPAEEAQAELPAEPEPVPAAEPGPAAASEPAETAAAPAADEPAPEAPSAETSAASMDSAGTRPASPAPPADEPPATPAYAAQASPVPLGPSATPTGLGLSTLPPLSPTLPTAVPAATPAATPLGGVAADTGRVSNALQAAVQALGCGAGRSPQPAPAEADLVFRGFGSPLKQDAESPESMPVSISAAVCPTSMPRATPAGTSAAEEVQVHTSATTTPAALNFQLGEERELTLEEMMGSPAFASDCDDMAEAGPTPTLQMAPQSEARPAPQAATPTAHATPGLTAAPTPSSVVVRTVTKAHPLTPSRQVVLEEEEQDYIMQTADEVEEQQETASLLEQQHELAEGEQWQEEAAAFAANADMAAAEAPSPAPALERPAAARLQSKVVVPSPNTFDPRSLRQLKREVADRLAAKKATVPRGVESDAEGESDEGDYIGAAPGGEELTDALGALSLEPGMHHGLRGLPTPAGKHIRFDEECEVAAVSPRQRVYLRGMPQPQGTHIHFDD